METSTEEHGQLPYPMVKKLEMTQWAIRRLVPKPAMIGHGTVSETEVLKSN